MLTQLNQYLTAPDQYLINGYKPIILRQTIA